MSNEIDPPIKDNDWGSLPFPFLDMQGADVTVRTTDTQQVFRGFLSINRHQTDDTLFSVVVVISDLPTGHWAVHTQLRVRLSPAATATIQRDGAQEAQRSYTLAIPLESFGYVRLPDQLRREPPNS